MNSVCPPKSKHVQRLPLFSNRHDGVGAWPGSEKGLSSFETAFAQSATAQPVAEEKGAAIGERGAADRSGGCEPAPDVARSFPVEADLWQEHPNTLKSVCHLPGPCGNMGLRWHQAEAHPSCPKVTPSPWRRYLANGSPVWAQPPLWPCVWEGLFLRSLSGLWKRMPTLAKRICAKSVGLYRRDGVYFGSTGAAIYHIEIM